MIQVPMPERSIALYQFNNTEKASTNDKGIPIANVIVYNPSGKYKYVLAL